MKISVARKEKVKHKEAIAIQMLAPCPNHLESNRTKVYLKEDSLV